MLYIFVEGPDDTRFFAFLLKEKDIKCVEYAKMAKKKIESYIKSITAISSDDYIFTADADGASIDYKKEKISTHYPFCNRDKIYIVQREIESWYLAGVKDDAYPLLKKKKVQNTDNLSKEEFLAIKPKHHTRITFMTEILECYNLCLACSRNTSLSYFVHDICI